MLPRSSGDCVPLCGHRRGWQSAAGLLRASALRASASREECDLPAAFIPRLLTAYTIALRAQESVSVASFRAIPRIAACAILQTISRGHQSLCGQIHTVGVARLGLRHFVTRSYPKEITISKTLQNRALTGFNRCYTKASAHSLHGRMTPRSSDAHKRTSCAGVSADVWDRA